MAPRAEVSSRKQGPSTCGSQGRLGVSGRRDTRTESTTPSPRTRGTGHPPRWPSILGRAACGTLGTFSIPACFETRMTFSGCITPAVTVRPRIVWDLESAWRLPRTPRQSLIDGPETPYFDREPLPPGMRTDTPGLRLVTRHGGCTRKGARPSTSPSAWQVPTMATTGGFKEDTPPLGPKPPQRGESVGVGGH